VPTVIDPNLIIAALTDGFAFAMLLFLIASGFSIIFGLMGILNFAHGAFFMMGAYVGVTLYESTNNFVIAILGGSLVGFLLGAVVERLTLRRIRGNPIAQIMITLGYLLIFTQLVLIIWGLVPRIFYPFGPPGTTLFLGFRLSIYLTIYRVFLIFLGLALAAVTYLFLTKTRLGTIVRAGTEDAEMVEALGINVKRTFTLTFGLGTALAALGGVVAVPWLAATADMGTTWLFISLVVTVVGGLGSFKGAFYGSLFIGILHEFSEYFFPQLTFVIDFLAMAVVLLIRPEGFFGEKK
jgi:branched-chain amino acid transport system permease protein